MSATVPDNLTSRVAVLEQIASDTREGLSRIERRLDRVDERIDRLDERIGRGDEWVSARLDRMDEKINARIDRMDERINARIDTSTRWLITLGLGGFAALLGAMAHGFHWI